MQIQGDKLLANLTQSAKLDEFEKDRKEKKKIINRLKQNIARLANKCLKLITVMLEQAMKYVQS